jgi:carbonic anhydrase/acetyltransferase-like protein (isoleucine patch superfamily)
MMNSQSWKGSLKLLTKCKARFVSPLSVILGDPEIGEDTWIGHFTVLDGSNGLKIGRGVSIASGVHIYTHSTHLLTALGKPKLTGPVIIGDHVAIGANSVVHYGCVIGNRSVVGSLSMLKPNTMVPDGEFWCGIPAKFKKKVSQ